MKDCVLMWKKRCTNCACVTGAIEKRVIIIIIIIMVLLPSASGQWLYFKTIPKKSTGNW